MDQSSPDNLLETEEEDAKVFDAGNKDFEDSERRRMESVGEEDEEAQSYMSERSSYLHIPYGFQSRGTYKHASKNCEIVGGRIIFFIIILYIYVSFNDILVIQLLITSFTLHSSRTCLYRRGWGGGVLKEFLGGDVLLGPWNP